VDSTGKNLYSNDTGPLEAFHDILYRFLRRMAVPPLASLTVNDFLDLYENAEGGAQSTLLKMQSRLAMLHREHDREEMATALVAEYRKQLKNISENIRKYDRERKLDSQTIPCLESYIVSFRLALAKEGEEFAGFWKNEARQECSFAMHVLDCKFRRRGFDSVRLVEPMIACGLRRAAISFSTIVRQAGREMNHFPPLKVRIVPTRWVMLQFSGV
jgi:hypothetical protein